MQHSDFFVYFGPRRSYLVQTPGLQPISTLPVSNRVQTIFNQSKKVTCVAYPPIIDDSEPLPDPFFAHEMKGFLGDDAFHFTDAIRKDYHGLEQWTSCRWGTAVSLPYFPSFKATWLIIQGTQVLADNRGGWWACSWGLNSTYAFLPANVTSCLQDIQPGGKVTHVALGIKGAFVVLYENGRMAWNLCGAYDELDMHLSTPGAAENILYVSMSIFDEGRYFIAYKDHRILYNFPEDDGGRSDWDLLDEWLRYDSHCQVLNNTRMVDFAKQETKSGGISGFISVITERMMREVINEEVEEQICRFMKGT
ncbi:hypothetical protein ASPWEDRAFT_24058 [Aspergillus wentii DTO 134E9]|uniref:Uncharacterized protein n=1 Tax=Aspergillus wentii DTO 134E9 TaxID=1073089 RepID=A0A1L9RSZ6_ASPWE|nr:uncharacterized protein ASPWEDRAFT_24058 [Aspergillus wentii DTO 134E9]KAI9933745.1 hypothetical protein MW887_004817 [Aspergillus wentii]OJJ38086.1 hypothetical protein ASPWEDRAFT_24058 [Aspergillus wentii DTO 134E9]